MKKRVRQVLTLVRQRFNLPVDDVDLLYYILRNAPLGISLNRICVMLGLHATDFSTAWALLKKMCERHNVKLRHWGTRGPAVVCLTTPHPLGEYYKAIAPLMRDYTRDGYITPPPRKVSDSSLLRDEDLQLYDALPPRFTRKHICEVRGCTLPTATRIADKFLRAGFAQVVKPGQRGCGHEFIYEKTIRVIS